MYRMIADKFVSSIAAASLVLTAVMASKYMGVEVKNEVPVRISDYTVITSDAVALTGAFEYGAFGTLVTLLVWLLV